jgi:hypothetical protein
MFGVTAKRTLWQRLRLRLERILGCDGGNQQLCHFFQRRSGHLLLLFFLSAA